jgi:hypothetical protein
MPIPFTRRFGAEREPMSLLVTALTCGVVIVAITYFVFLYWFTHR